MRLEGQAREAGDADGRDVMYIDRRKLSVCESSPVQLALITQIAKLGEITACGLQGVVTKVSNGVVRADEGRLHCIGMCPGFGGAQNLEVKLSRTICGILYISGHHLVGSGHVLLKALGDGVGCLAHITLAVVGVGDEVHCEDG